MTDGRHIGNQKFGIFPQPLNRSRRNFAWTCNCGCKSFEKLKSAYFSNSRWRTAAILKSKIRNISRIVQPIATAICMKMQIVANNRAKKLKFAYFRNLIWRTAAILENEYSLHIYYRSSDYDEFLHEHADCCRKQRGRLKFAYFKIQDGGRPPYWKSNICNISANIQPIATKFSLNM